MNKRLKEQINLAFFTPEPVRKSAFLGKLRPREITTPALMLQQVPYIRMNIWLSAVFILTIAVVGACIMNTNTERAVEALVPLAAAAASLEIQRSCRYHMTDLEMATRFSLKSVICARMLIIGVVYTAVFCTVAPVVSVRFGIGVTIVVFRILVPFLIATSLCLRIERTKMGRENSYLSVAAAGAISMGIIWVSSYEMARVVSVIEKWGLLIIIPFLIMAIYENYKTITSTEVFA